MLGVDYSLLVTKSSLEKERTSSLPIVKLNIDALSWQLKNSCAIVKNEANKRGVLFVAVRAVVLVLANVILDGGRGDVSLAIAQ